MKLLCHVENYLPEQSGKLPSSGCRLTAQSLTFHEPLEMEMGSLPFLCAGSGNTQGCAFSPFASSCSYLTDRGDTSDSSQERFDASPSPIHTYLAGETP